MKITALELAQVMDDFVELHGLHVTIRVLKSHMPTFHLYGVNDLALANIKYLKSFVNTGDPYKPMVEVLKEAKA